MIKNGRPYSNENGYIDDGLITSHNEREVKAVKQWIADNIKTGRKILHNRTSYGIKHLLEHDTGIYLTNNEFKDAMLLAGYSPVNSNVLNWKYRIIMKKEINDDPSKFFNWAKAYEKEVSPCGDFVQDMLQDFDFPTSDDYNIIKRYLERIGACDGAIDAFKELWRAYERERN